jgi:peptidoglycan/LPS O-acetylase OafA/YrhL
VFIYLKKNNYSVPESFSDSINAIRWLSAFMVVISHTRALLISDITQNISQDYLRDGFYFITGFGHQAVVVFFVLSGYLVGGSVLKDAQIKKLSIKKYGINRISRLYIVLVPAILITALLDGTGICLLNQGGIYSGKIVYSALSYSVTERFSFISFWANIFMLQGSLGYSTFGSNGPLWSLANEFWYYILFFGIVYCISIDSILKKTVGFLLIISICLMISPLILEYFGLWLLGLSIYFIPKLSEWIYYISLLVCIAVLFCIRSKKIFLLNGLTGDFILGIVFVFLLSQLKYKNYGWVSKYSILHRRLADFSYSLYLIHFPLALFIIAFLIQMGMIKNSNDFSLFIFGIFIIIVCLIYVISYYFGISTEGQTKKVRDWLFHLLK